MQNITYGTKAFHKKIRLQAFCADLYSPELLESILAQLSKDPKLVSVTDKILAFRTESEEGYDDGCTLGAGEKLLHMLERMNAENIVLMIFLWDYGYIGRQGTELFKIILDSARELLLTLHNKNIKIDKDEKKQTVTSKFFSFNEIPNIKKTRSIKNARPSHFMGDLKLASKERVSEDLVVTESELYNAVNQVESALRALTQSDIIELRSSSSNQLVMKVLQMVCILKGYNASTWNNIKEMLDSRTFKIELGMIDVFKITKRQSHIVRSILKDNSKLNIENLNRVSLPAATLLSWVQGVITWHAGRNIVKISNFEQMEPKKPSQITNSNWGTQSRSKPGHKIDEEIEDDLVTVKKIKGSTDIEEKLRKTRELKVEYEERIERILKTRLDEVNFEGEKVELNDEDIIKYLGSQSLQQHPTSVLLALVDKLKERRVVADSNSK
jgi:Uncharacterized protein family UPF0029